MRKLKHLLLILGFTVAMTAQAEIAVDPHKMHDLIVIAGYSTALGAAVGAAVLAFTEKPSKHLPYLYRGAAIGFLAGAAVGSYVIFSPLLMPEPTFSTTSVLDHLDYVPDPQALGARLVVSPIFQGLALREVAAKFTLVRL